MLKSIEFLKERKKKAIYRQSKDILVLEMLQLLQEMGTDTYLQCKYTMQAVSRGKGTEEDFVEKLFTVTDRRRPVLIGMKKGGAV